MRRREVTLLRKSLPAWRGQRGWSQKQLSLETKKLGEDRRVSEAAIAMYETGDRQPSKAALEALAEAIGIHPEALGYIHPDEMVGVAS